MLEIWRISAVSASAGASMPRAYLPLLQLLDFGGDIDRTAAHRPLGIGEQFGQTRGLRGSPQRRANHDCLGLAFENGRRNRAWGETV